MPDQSERPQTPNLDPKAIRELASAQCDRTLTAAEARRLEAALSESGEARAIYVAFMDVHAGLDWNITSQAMAFDSDSPDQAALPRLGWTLPQTVLRLSAWPYLTVCATLALMVIAWALYPRIDANGPPATKTEIAEPVIATVADLSTESRWITFNRAGNQDRVVHGAPISGAPRTSGGAESLRSGEYVELETGQLALQFTSGAVVTLAAPAVLQVISPMRARAVRGTITTRVAAGAKGFTVEAPRATVVDLGTRFGMEVNPSGRTKVVVFEGSVDLKYGAEGGPNGKWQRRQLTMGEALQVDAKGSARRVMSVANRRFADDPEHQSIDDDRDSAGTVVISELRDTIRTPDSYNYYGMVHGRMGEDAKAFVDREEHEWNGLDASGMPAYLVGGDYVQMFNNDKTTHDIEVFVSLACAARLYILFDDRAPPPAWLLDGFRDTGDNMGLDVGKFNWKGRFDDSRSPGVGPGVSIDETVSIWVREVLKPGIVRLGATEAPDHHVNMYGIVAVATK